MKLVIWKHSFSKHWKQNLKKSFRWNQRTTPTNVKFTVNWSLLIWHHWIVLEEFCESPHKFFKTSSRRKIHFGFSSLHCQGWNQSHQYEHLKESFLCFFRLHVWIDYFLSFGSHVNISFKNQILVKQYAVGSFVCEVLWNETVEITVNQNDNLLCVSESSIVIYITRHN